MRKERFLAQRTSKLHLEAMVHFKSLRKINDNAYKIDLPGEYNISATFNVSHLCHFDVGDDLRLNPFGEGGDDANHQVKQVVSSASSDPLLIPNGLIIRAHAKRFKEEFFVF